MSEARDLREFMTALSEELGTWSRASRKVEAVCGTLAERSGATPAEIQALQSLDQISQHLDQLARLCGDLGDGAGNATTVAAAIDRLGLSGLRARLSRTEVTPAVSGKVELW